MKTVLLVSHLQYFELVGVDFTPGLLQSGHWTHVHASCDTHTYTQLVAKRRSKPTTGWR